MNNLPGRPRPPAWAPIVSIVVALFYGVSPVDLIPEVIPLFGLLDDALVVPTFLLLGIVWWARRKRAQRDDRRAAIEIAAKAD
ncbi:MAG: DUF1232 domain-containing protein [Fimbriimonadaceae bacterium]|nr:DUF1232 domain-containing protein [Fimbriimonadaceae bacterium]